jgi:catechol 2,3-dioxygenase-like lactoylglutathione lyase family enzyme
VKLRVARHTADLKSIVRFYCGILGLEVLGHFEDHIGYDGIFLGLKDISWHLEFTKSAEAPEHHPDEDDLLVFYLNNVEEVELLKEKFAAKNITSIPAKNPYWDANGTLYPDPDGFGVMITVAQS